MKLLINIALVVFLLTGHSVAQTTGMRQMLFGDTSSKGVPYSKDPHVIKFKGEFLMYYSIPPFEGNKDPMPFVMPFQPTEFILHQTQPIPFFILKASGRADEPLMLRSSGLMIIICSILLPAIQL